MCYSAETRRGFHKTMQLHMLCEHLVGLRKTKYFKLDIHRMNHFKVTANQFVTTGDTPCW